MASKKSTILFVEIDEQRVYYKPEGFYGKFKSDRFRYLSKVDRIATLYFCNYKFVGKPPMQRTDEELNSYWSSICQAYKGMTFGTDPRSEQPKEDFYPQPIPTTPKENPMPTTTKTTTTGGLDDVLRNIVTEVMGTFVPEIDETKVSEMVNSALAPYTETFETVVSVVGALSTKVDTLRPKITEIKLPNKEVRRVEGIQHNMFPAVLASISEGLPTYLVGPAGTGKSTIAENAAKALGLEFRSKSCSSQSTESSLLGYMSATGQYISTGFREAFEFGHVYLLDEVDNGNANILTVLNSALSNTFMAFPDGMVKRHENFVLIATANTFGNGATAEYVGRNALDKAFLDRFASLTIGYDEAVEEAMLSAIELDSMLSAKWLNIVRVARKNAEAFGLKVVVSPRATVNGAKLLRHDSMTIETVAKATFLKGLSQEQSDKLLSGVTL